MTENDGADPRQRLRPNRDDKHHDQQLLRNVPTINDQTARALGPLPPDGLPVIPKRKPQLSRPAVAAMAQLPPPSDEDMTMQWKSMAAVAALATGGVLTACGADGAAARVDPPAVAVPDAPTPTPLPTVAAVPPVPEATAVESAAPADENAPEPARGPSIPAAQLLRQILALLGSFEKLEDLERENVERAFSVRMNRDPEAADGYTYHANTTEGWTYWIDTSRLHGKDQPSTTYIYLDDGAASESDPPAHCTFELEALAKEFVALGYKRDDGIAKFKGNVWWNFDKTIPHANATFYPMVYLYRVSNEDGERYCVSRIKIGGDVSNG